MTNKYRPTLPAAAGLFYPALAEAALVARLRALRLMGGGYRARQEWHRMLRDRQSMLIETRAALAQSLAGGQGLFVPWRLADIWCRRLHETHVRLSAS